LDARVKGPLKFYISYKTIHYNLFLSESKKVGDPDFIHFSATIHDSRFIFSERVSVIFFVIFHNTICGSRTLNGCTIVRHR